MNPAFKMTYDEWKKMKDKEDEEVAAGLRAPAPPTPAVEPLTTDGHTILSSELHWLAKNMECRELRREAEKGDDPQQRALIQMMNGTLEAGDNLALLQASVDPPEWFEDEIPDEELTDEQREELCGGRGLDPSTLSGSNGSNNERERLFLVVITQRLMD